MNVLLIGGPGTFTDNLIIKLEKEGHRVFLLTGSKYTKGAYHRVFEQYHFAYDSGCLPEVFESVNPELTIYMGAYDTNLSWEEEKADAVRYLAGVTNILMGYAVRGGGRFLYLSSDSVYGADYDRDITEEEPVSPAGVRGMTLAQAEELCGSYHRDMGKDIIVLRLDHLYSIPENRAQVRDVCSRMCLQALEKNEIEASRGLVFSLLYETDAVEFIYRMAVAKKHNHTLYHIASPECLTQYELAEQIRDACGGEAQLQETHVQERRVLSGKLFESEIGNPFFCDTAAIVKKIADKMQKNRYAFLTGKEEKLPLRQRFLEKLGWLARAMVPVLENLAVFGLVFWLSGRAADSAYFANLDFYLLYVLLFAIVYGQQQATFSSVLSAAGYCLTQAQGRSGFEVILDAKTYVWIAQLFILGLTVGYMRDYITKLKRESREENEFLRRQLADIQDINTSNVRVKDALETQIVNQSDSVGKIYSITSALEQYSPEEVLFYAVEVLGKLIKSKDVAIYTVSNDSYARLFSSTSKKARMLGNSIQYTRMGELYDTLKEGKVYINRKMDERYPLMANAIYEKDAMQMIIMVWGLSWERMTLGQANQLVVISSLIQNAVLRAKRYLSVLENQRYVEGTRILETQAFAALAGVYLKARDKELTECTLLWVETGERETLAAAKLLAEKLRQTDYLGILQDGRVYVLLANTNREDAQYVIGRFAGLGFGSRIVEELAE